MFDFTDLIESYSNKHIYVEKVEDGYYNDFNEWIESKKEYINIFGAITRLSKDELQYQEGGTYSFDDRKLYCYHDLTKGCRVKHKDKTYTVQDKLDYSEFDASLEDGLFIYYLRRGDND